MNKAQELRIQLLTHYKAVIDLSVRVDKYGKNGVPYYRSDHDYFDLVLGIDFKKCYDSKLWMSVSNDNTDELKESLHFLNDNDRWTFIGDTLTQVLHNRLSNISFEDINEDFESGLFFVLNKTYKAFKKLDKVANLEQQVKQLKAEIADLKQMEIA